MKKRFVLFTTLAAFSFVACQKEAEQLKEPVKEVELTEITAVANVIETKTYVDGLQVKWNAGDVIAVANEDEDIVEFTLNGGENTASATFTGDLSGKALGTYAVYPSTTNSFVLDNDACVDYLDEWEYGRSEVPMYGVNNGSGAYSFHNIGGALQVTYTNVPSFAKKFKLTETHTGGEAKPITGTVNVEGMNSTPTVSLTTGGSEVIVTKLVPDGENSVTVVIPVLAGTGYSFRVELLDADSNTIPGSAKTASNRTIAANRITRFPAIALATVTKGKTYTLTPTTKTTDGFSDWNTAWAKNSISWTPAKVTVNGSPSVGAVDSNRGQQFGAKNTNQVSSMAITGIGSGYATFCNSTSAYGINSIDVSGCAADGNTLTLGVKVGGVSMTADQSSHTISGSGAEAVVTTHFTSAQMLYGNIEVSLSISTAGAVYLKSLTINPKSNPGIAWKKSGVVASEDTASLETGDDTMPTATLDNPNSVTVSYESSDTAVATIDPSSGEITLVGTGTTTISATSVETTDYASASVDYSLTVSDNRTVCETPTFDVPAGEVSVNTDVTVSSETTGSTIYYTVDGTTPTTDSTHGTAGAATVVITINEGKTIKAIAVKDDYVTSSVASATYTIAGQATKLNNPSGLALTSMTAAGFTATWTAVDNASSYDWTLSTADNYNDVAPANTKGSGNVTTASANITSLELTTDTYYLYVKTKGNGSTYADADGASSARAFMIQIDFTSDSQRPDGFPTTTKGTTATAYTIEGYSFTFYGTSGNGYKWNAPTDKYLINGKSGAYILTPAISGKTLKNISFTTSSGNSTAVVLNIKSANGSSDFFNNTSAVGQGTSKSWTLTGTPTVNTSYRLQVTSSHNIQLTKLSLMYSF